MDISKMCDLGDINFKKGEMIGSTKSARPAKNSLVLSGFQVR